MLTCTALDSSGGPLWSSWRGGGGSGEVYHGAVQAGCDGVERQYTAVLRSLIFSWALGTGQWACPPLPPAIDAV